MPIGMLCGFLFAAVVSSALPKVYESNAVIEVMPLFPTSEQGNITEGEAPKWLSDEIGKIKSRESLERVVDHLKLVDRWNLDRHQARRKLEDSMTVMSIRGTGLVSIRVRHTDKVGARDMVMAVARNYAELREDNDRRVSQQRCDALKDAIKDQEKLLEERIVALEVIDKKRVKNITGPGGNTTLLHLTESQDYRDAKGALEAAESILAALRNKLRFEDPDSSPPINSVRMHQEAGIGGIPVSPNVALNLVIGSVVGFLLSPLVWRLSQMLRGWSCRKMVTS
jgi:uncharacterized protein involved in exopolysaccharide biosynthesis